MEDISKRVIEVMAHIMREKDLKQVEVCKEAGVSQAYLSLLLAGKKKNASCRIVISLVRAMGVDLAQFVRMLEAENTWDMNVNP